MTVDLRNDVCSSSLPRTVVRSGCTQLERAQIGRTADIAVIDIRQSHSFVDCGTAGFQLEIERLHVEHARRILILRGYEILERVVSDFDAMGVLAGGLRVLLERRVGAL